MQERLNRDSTSLSTPQLSQPQFLGSVAGYFRIWIVNILLTMATFGLFSAWSKVRRKQYFCANTLVLGSSFEYTADPWSILRGRLIAYGLVLASIVARWIELRGYVVLVLVFFLVLPYLKWSSARFNARSIRWRGIQFNFTGSVTRAYLVWLILPFAIPFTLGLLFPYVVYRQQRYLVESHWLGNAPMRYRADGPKGHYKALVVPVVVFLIYFFVLFALVVKNPQLVRSIPADWRTTYLLFAIYSPFLIAYSFWRAGTANLLVGNVVWKDVVVFSNVRMFKLLWLYASGLSAIILSLGLLTPWAAIRVYRYRLDTIRVENAQELETACASLKLIASATGQEVADAFDVGLEFGL